MSHCANLTYHQKNRDVILNRANDYTKTYLKKKKIKRENMEKTDISICLKKRNKD